MAKWVHQRKKLHAHHHWTGRHGNKIFVANAGDVRFEFPASWIVEPDACGSIRFHDAKPPKDNCRLEVSVIQLPPIDYSQLKLIDMMDVAFGKDARPIDHRGPIEFFERGGLQVAWRQLSFIDPNEKREARSRLCLARRRNVQAIITFDYWADDALACEEVWDVVLESLRLAQPIADPTRGPADG